LLADRLLLATVAAVLVLITTDMIFLDYDFGVRAETGRFFAVFDPTG
jgi:hypothetical protein